MSWFNARTVDPSDGFTLFESVSGVTMRTVAGERKETSNKDGVMLVLEHEFLDGPYVGKRFINRFNIQNPNAQSVEYAFRDLSALCHVCGVFDLASMNAQEIFGIPFKADVVKTEAKGDKSASNSLRNYRDMHGRKPSEIKGGAPAPQQPTTMMPTQPMPQAQPQPQPGQGAWPQPQSQQPAGQPAPGGWPQPGQQPQQPQPNPAQGGWPQQPAPQAPQAPQQPPAGPGGPMPWAPPGGAAQPQPGPQAGGWPQQPQQAPQPAPGGWPQPGQPAPGQGWPQQ